MAVIGVDLGGTKLAAAAFTVEGDTLARTTMPLEGRSGRAVGRLVNDCVADVETQCLETITGVGMCVPGIFSPATGRVWAPNIKGWEDFPLLDVLRDGTASDLPTRISSDRSCSILGEIWQGAARSCSDAIYLAVGTGIGAGIVSAGRIVEGWHGIAGAAGWMALDRPFRAEYKRWGCFEHAASGDGLVRHARDLAERGEWPDDYDGPLRRTESISGSDIFQALKEDDVVARRIVDNAVALWGMAVANLVSLFNPEKIIFGGGVFGPAVSQLGRIRSEAERWAQPIAMKSVVLEPSRLGGDAALVGAARLALDETT